jgi:hypothetical protein
MKQSLGYASPVLVILGLIGIVSETGPAWARYATLGLGILLYLLPLLKFKNN